MLNDTFTSAGDSASSKSEKDRESALEMRRIARETFGESKERKREEEEENSTISKKKKSRSSGNDTIEYLREKKYSGNEYPRERVADEGKTARIREAKISKYDAFYSATTTAITSATTTAAATTTAVSSKQSQLMMNMLQQENKWKES